MRVKGFRKLDKDLISRGILFKKIAIMHGKDEFSKIKGNTFSINKKAANICNILPRPTVSNGLIVINTINLNQFAQTSVFFQIS